MPGDSQNPWTALGDPTRKAIFEYLVDRPRAVVELASELPVSRPAVSQHLRVLTETGLVTLREEGNRRLYRAHLTHLAEVRTMLDQFWGERLARLSDELSNPDER